jgi:hypothetical protein
MNSDSYERLNSCTKISIPENLNKFLVESIDDTSTDFRTIRKKSMTLVIKENTKSWN